jgi:hypothetical protein
VLTRAAVVDAVASVEAVLNRLVAQGLVETATRRPPGTEHPDGTPGFFEIVAVSRSNPAYIIAAPVRAA